MNRINQLVILIFVISTNAEKLVKFPKDFKFGVSTSAYQIEGAWNIDGKGENIWDTFTHNHPERIMDLSNGDISADSYHRVQDDVNILRELGVDFYRFSLSWSRILPTGFINHINYKGINYYNNLIDNLLKYNIKPMVTLYHWDLPQHLQELGGWANSQIADYFEDFAKIAFENFGDRVKTWLTFNEPKVSCVYGYGGIIMAPGVNVSGIGEYLCGHTVLVAHAKVYHLYNKYYKNQQKGEIGISMHSEWFEPSTEKSEEIAEQKLQFDLGWFAHPIFQKDYPAIMKTRIYNKSMEQGYSRSRLPVFTQEQIEYIHGTYDFFSLNFYTASLVSKASGSKHLHSSFQDDSGAKSWKDSKWPESIAKRIRVVPWAFRKMLRWIKKNYGDVRIVVTENGFADDGRLDDKERVSFYQQYLTNLHEAIYEDGIKVEGFSAWSLLDNFEWFGGYKERYGLYSVDFNDKCKKRSAKLSAKFYQNLISTRLLRSNYNFLNSSIRIYPNSIIMNIVIFIIMNLI